jgi:hypothetical protein
VDGVFDNGNDVLRGGVIKSITIVGEMSGDSCFVASDFPAFARVDGRRINTSTDPRFVDEIDNTLSAGGTQANVNWLADSKWNLGYSPFSAPQAKSNFPDFVTFVPKDRHA